MEERAISRHVAIINPSWFNMRRVTILGVGAGGLTTAILLAKLGVNQILVCDVDTVELENLGPSLYGLEHARKAMRKVDACAHILQRDVGLSVNTYHGYAEDIRDFGDVVFLCVDSNDTKLRLVEGLVASNEHMPERIFEGRMSASNFLTHSFDPRDRNHVARWKQYYMPDEQVLNTLPGCGAARVSLSTVASMAASMLVQHFIDWIVWEHRGQVGALINQVFFDLGTYASEPAYWD